MANKPDIGKAYLIVGTNLEKRDDLLKRIRTRMCDYGDMTMNIDKFEGSNLDGARIESACLTLPFLSQKRLVEVHLGSKVSSDLSDTLIDYLDHAVESCVLVVVSDSLAKNTKIYKAFQSFDKKCILACEEPKTYEFESYVVDLAEKKGVKFAPHAARHLVDLIGNDTLQLSNELNKLITSHTTDDPISIDEIDSLTEHLAKVKPWVFVDAFAARNFMKCLELFDCVEGTTHIGLMYMCVTRVRELLCAKHCIRTGRSSQKDVALELGLAEAQSWRCKNHIAWSKQYTEKELVEALKTALICETKMKSGTNPRTAFLDWVCSVLDRNKLKFFA